MPPAVIIAAFHPFSALPRIPVVMTGREYGLMAGLAIRWGVSFFFSKVALGEPVAAPAFAGMALIFAGLLAIDGRLVRARRAAVAPARPRSKAA